jgi:hypothetical protein
MAAPSFSPKFVKARLAFTIDGHLVDAGEHLLNSTGVPGFRWKSFQSKDVAPQINPLEWVGRKTSVYAKTISSEPFQFNCDAMFTCEQTEKELTVGLVFLLKELETTTLDSIITQEGVLPDYVRKFPRIHYVPWVPVFPSRALVGFYYDQEDITVSCDIENMSPSGLSLYSEDPRLRFLTPAEMTRVQIQPRGSFEKVIPLNAEIKRITHTIDPETHNPRKVLGLSITTISYDHKLEFTDLLRQIVTRMKG